MDFIIKDIRTGFGLPAPKDYYKNYYKDKYGITSHQINTYEAYTELWALLLNTNINSEHKEIGNKQLKKIGLSNNSWYVTLHVREPGYKDEKRLDSSERRGS